MTALSSAIGALGQGFDSRAIANKILEKAAARGQPLTIMQLVKLIYFAQGWYLAFVDKPITYHPAQAWQYGPVYPHVYKAFPKAGSAPLQGLILDKATGKPYVADFHDDEAELIDWILEQYGRMHAFQLSQLTHADDGPWKITYDATGPYSEIPLSLMRSYFKRFVALDEPVGQS
jgi:uncharacterized phage-associated protein